MKFISSKDNLKTIMLLLRDKSPAIQFEAFHVFKVFVANPKKPPEVGRRGRASYRHADMWIRAHTPTQA